MRKGARFCGDVAGVQSHVTALDSLGGERAERAQVLCEANGRRHRRELGRGRDVGDLRAGLHHRVHAVDTADGADCHGQRHPADQVSVLGAPRRERGVASVARGPCVGARLDGAEVLAERDEHGVDAVHHAFVVRAGAIRVALREDGGLLDALGQLFTAREALSIERLVGHAADDRDRPSIGEVGQDAQAHAPARELADARREALAHRVDRVGAHRVAHVDDQMQDEHVAARVLVVHAAEPPHLDREGAAARAYQRGVPAIGALQQLGCGVLHGALRRVEVGDVEHLDLTDADRLRDLRLDAAAGAQQLGRIARRRHDRGLLDAHRHEHVAAVEQHVRAHAQGQAMHAQGVLDHAVGLVLTQAAARREARHVACRHAGQRRDLRASLVQG